MEKIGYGMLADRAGVPVSVRAFTGNMADLTTFIKIAAEIEDLAGVQDMVMVAGPRGMIASARTTALKDTT